MKINLFGSKINIVVFVMILLVGMLVGSSFCSCVARPTAGSNTQTEAMALLGSNTQTEAMAMLDYRMGKGVKGARDKKVPVEDMPPYETYPGDTEPCKKNFMRFFDNTKFDPNCCAHSNISNSMGCACVTKEQIRCLFQRGGNNPDANRGI